MVVACLIALGAVGVALVGNRDRGDGVAGAGGAVPTVPGVTVPELPEPTDTSAFASGWYLILSPMIFTTEDELLLQAARELMIEARNAGYGEAKLIRPPGSPHRCDADGVCASTTAPDGYFIVLKGPYVVPDWGDSQADMDAEYQWHQTIQASEVAEATARGLTLEPGLALLEF